MRWQWAESVIEEESNEKRSLDDIKLYDTERTFKDRNGN